MVHSKYIYVGDTKLQCRDLFSPSRVFCVCILRLDLHYYSVSATAPNYKRGVDTGCPLYFDITDHKQPETAFQSLNHITLEMDNPPPPSQMA